MKAVIALAALATLGSAPAQEATQVIGNWTVKKTVDSFSDAKRGIAHTAIDTKAGTIAVKCD